MIPRIYHESPMRLLCAVSFCVVVESKNKVKSFATFVSYVLQPSNTEDVEDNDKKKGKGFDLKIEICIRGRGSRRKG